MFQPERPKPYRMSEQENYETYLRNVSESYEALCQRCGVCCGAGAYESDPCAQLKKGPDGRYFCATYENRVGMQKTNSGKEFKCVPVRKILFESWCGAWQCGYKRTVDSP